jgi:hypothetical protein
VAFTVQEKWFVKEPAKTKLSCTFFHLSLEETPLYITCEEFLSGERTWRLSPVFPHPSLIRKNENIFIVGMEVSILLRLTD